MNWLDHVRFILNTLNLWKLQFLIYFLNLTWLHLYQVNGVYCCAMVEVVLKSTFLVPFQYLSNTFLVPFQYLSNNFLVPFQYLSSTFLVPFQYLSSTFIVPFQYLLVHFQYLSSTPRIMYVGFYGILPENLVFLLLLQHSSSPIIEYFPFAQFH